VRCALHELQLLREHEPWQAVALARSHRDGCMEFARYARAKGDRDIVPRKVRAAREHNRAVVRALNEARAAGVPGVRS
jgi:hypothetical protein